MTTPAARPFIRVAFACGRCGKVLSDDTLYADRPHADDDYLPQAAGVKSAHACRDHNALCPDFPVIVGAFDENGPLDPAYVLATLFGEAHHDPR